MFRTNGMPRAQEAQERRVSVLHWVSLAACVKFAQRFFISMAAKAV